MLESAVHDWNNKSDEFQPGDSMKTFCARLGLSKGTFGKMVTKNDKVRAPIGATLGRSTLLTPNDASFVVDNIRRADRAHDGKTVVDVIDLIQEVKPELSHTQASNAYRRTVKPGHSKLLTGVVTAQPTTTKRSGVTVAGQYRWHRRWLWTVALSVFW